MKMLFTTLVMSVLVITTTNTEADHKLETDIIINAAASEVWQHLSDWQAYPSWNPFITAISGTQQKGEFIKVTIKPEGSNGMSISPTLLNIIENQEIRWKGELLFKGIFDGEHYFIIEPINNKKVRFVHGERFSGLLFPLIWYFIAEDTERGFKTMNTALKKQVETQINDKFSED